MGAHFGAGLDPAIDARLFWPAQTGDQPGRGPETGLRVFGIEPDFDGCPFRGEIDRRDKFARGLQDHPFDEIDAIDRLGDGMLDLQPGVDLQKIEILAHHIVDEFDRACRFVSHRLAKRDGRGMHAGAGLQRQARCRGFLDDFLVAALQRAIALAKRQHPAIAQAEYLHFDMAGGGDETLEIDAGVAKTRRCHSLHRRETGGQRRFVVAKLHADAAAARRAFQHHGIADASRRRDRLRDGIQQAGARQQRHAATGGDVPRRVFQPKMAQMLRFGANENNALCRQPLGKTGVFRQEAIAGMHSFGPGRLGGGDDGIDVQIAVFCGSRADAHAFIRIEHGPRETVGVRIDRDRFYAKLAQGADDPGGDFAAVGDKDFREHGYFAALSKINTRTAVGLKPLHGLLT